MAAENKNARDEQAIRQLIADQQKAVGAKDIDRIMAHYAADVIVFNVKPPFQTRGAKDWRRTWETSLSHCCLTFRLRSGPKPAT